MSSSSDDESQPHAHTKTGVLQEYWQAMRTFSPSLRRLLIAMALLLVTAFGLLPVLQNLYLLRLGFDVQFIGLLAGLGQVVWATAALPAGMLGNRIGLRNGLLLGYGLFGVGLALLLLVESRPVSQWQAWLIASQAVVSLGIAMLTVNNPPYLMAVTGEKDRRYAFAAFSATIPAMAFVGSLAAGVLPILLAGQFGLSLDQPAPYRFVLWLGPVLACGAIVVLAGAEPAHVTRSGPLQQGATRAPLALLIFFGLVTFLSAIGEGAVRTFFNVYLDIGLGVSPAAIGSIMGLAQLLPIGAALAVPFLVARWGTGYALVAGMVATGICLVPLAAIPVVWVAAAAYMGVIAVVTVSGTARDMFGQEIVLPRWRTSSQGAAVIGLALGWSLAGIGGGALIKATGFSALYFAGALSALLAAGLLVGYLRRSGARVAAATEVAPVLSDQSAAILPDLAARQGAEP